MYVMDIQNDVVGLVLHENCKSKQVTDFIAWPRKYHDTIFTKLMSESASRRRDNAMVMDERDKEHRKLKIEQH